jgi:hypothetical protein
MEGKRERVKAKVIASFINMLRPRVGEEEEKEREREREKYSFVFDSVIVVGKISFWF